MMKRQKHEYIFHIRLRESTISEIEKITQKRYNNNGEKLVLEILDKIKKGNH